MSKFCVLYRVNGREERSAWFRSRQRAQRALAVIQASHGEAVIYAD